MEFRETTITSKKKKLLTKVIPKHAIKELKIIEKGWDSFVFLVNNRLIFRFPRRKKVALCLELEKKILPEIKRIVSLKVPNFKFICGSPNNFQKMFVGYDKIEGEEFSKKIYHYFKKQEVLPKISQQLGKFLTELHNFPLKKAKFLGVKETGSFNYWTQYFNGLRNKVFPHLGKKEKNWSKKIFVDFLAHKANFEFRKTLIHGDFGNCHILVNKEKERVVGVIDFSDIAIGDAAYDFCGFKSYEESFVKSVLKFYRRSFDAGFIKRINFYYQVVPFHLLLGGLNLKKREYFQEGIRLLQSRM